jgi:hypothetical protein
MKTPSVPLVISIIAILISILAIVIVSGIISPAPSGVDPIAGSWSRAGILNNRTISITLVFNEEGNFNMFVSGLMSLSGHWEKINSTNYDLNFGNLTSHVILTEDKTHIYESDAPNDLYTKQ